MSTLREAAEPDWLDEEPFYNAMQRYRCAPREDQREVVACFEAVKRLVRAELAKPDARPAPAEPQPIAAWSIVRTAESAVVTAVRAALSAAPAPQPAGGEPQPAAQQEPVPEGYMLVLVPKESPGGKPDWDECIRQSEVATGLKVDRNTFSIIKREVRRWLAQCHASQPAEEQAGERKPLTEAQIDRHSIAAVDCPPSSTVILVSSLRRLLNTKGDGHD